MDVLVNESLRNLNTFSVDVCAKRLVHAEGVDDVLAAIHLARELDVPFMLIGGGSNVLFVADYPGVIIHLVNRGVEVDRERAHVHVAAGENWHELVLFCMKQELYGIENLAMIPGSVGAAPVQNIGAYGVELAQRLDYVDVLDVETELVTRMSAEECQLAYRDSIFKTSLKDRAIILAVGLQLSRTPELVLDYPALKKYMTHYGLVPSPTTVFSAVCQIRRSRLPDPALLGNAGSFFKNPIISREQFSSLSDRFAGMPSYPLDEHRVKVPAAWLIEQAGWKGKRNGDAGVHIEQALVLVNYGKATGEEIVQLARTIATSVKRNFDIGLFTEVRIVPDQGNG